MNIYTIGHSTHTKEQFLSMLHFFEVRILADVRSYPGSRHVPQFNKEDMQIWLAEGGIKYIHIPKLGGRRRKIDEIDNSKVEGWDNIAFRNYSAYTLTDEFAQGLAELIDIAEHNTTCIMCAESVPWRCHRLILSNSLVAEGVHVMHIIDNNAQDHEINKYGAPAVMSGSKLIYPKHPLGH